MREFDWEEETERGHWSLGSPSPGLGLVFPGGESSRPTSHLAMLAGGALESRPGGAGTGQHLGGHSLPPFLFGGEPSPEFWLTCILCPSVGRLWPPQPALDPPATPLPWGGER